MRLFLKKFLSLSLILTLSLPAFSAVSVSDGSAFVSKAEFSTDMNNLSNRMAQLENSLDAKIDSLVSSYLSRNGIWNGEGQEVESNSVNYEMHSGDWLSSGEYGVFSKNFLVTSPLAKNLTKSGMLIWNGYWGLGQKFGASNSNAYIRIRKLGSASAEFFGLDLQFCTIPNGSTYIYDNVTLKNSFSYGTGYRGVGFTNGVAEENESHYHSVGAQTHYSSCSFFVNKGDDLLINFNAYGYKFGPRTDYDRYPWPESTYGAFIGVVDFSVFIY